MCPYITLLVTLRDKKIHQKKVTTCGLVFSLFFLLWSTYAYGKEIYFVDAHSQVDHNIKLDSIVALMKEAGIQKTILSARGKRKPGEIAILAETYPDQIVASVRTKSRHYKLNTNKYYKKLSAQLNSGRFKAMSEVLLYHAQKGDRADEVVIYPDDERVEAAFEGARKHGWPFVLHIEFASLRGNRQKKYFDALEKFLELHPDYPVVLIHMGQLDASEVKRLISKHKNIFFLHPIVIPLR